MRANPGRRRGPVRPAAGGSLGTLAVELDDDGDRPGGEEYAVEAVRLARAVGDPALLGRALNNYVIAAWAPGRDAGRRAALDESLAMVGAGLPLATEVVARLHRASLRLVGADLVGAERDLGRAADSPLGSGCSRWRGRSAHNVRRTPCCAVTRRRPPN